MAIKQTYFCDKCKGESQEESFRQDASNFFQMTFSCYPVAGGGSMMPGSPSTGVSRNETFQICKNCKPELDAALDAIINPLKA